MLTLCIYILANKLISFFQPYSDNSCGSIIRQQYKGTSSMALGITQILVGVLLILFNSIGVTLPPYNYQFVFYTGHGVWFGTFVSIVN